MNKIYLFVIIVAVLISAGIAGGIFYSNQKTVLPVSCTMEAMQCSDGSYVGRQGQKCEFAACPNLEPNGTSVIKGKVNVGPICPVEREGVPCPVPPEAYTSREVILYNFNKTIIVERKYFSTDGTYSFQISPGTYVLDIPKQGIGGSGELPKTIVVKSAETVEFNFSIDTGIR